MKQAQNLNKMVVPVAIDGIELNTSAADFRPMSQMRLARFNGTSFEPMGALISGD